MKREPFFDNARFFLIFLVVFGHVIQPLTSDSESLAILYQFIYFFHMPAIILISGFFAKGNSDLGYFIKLFRRFIIPYLIFQVLYTAYYYFMADESLSVSLFDPHWSLWFLLSLFSWHVLLAFFKKFRPTIGLSLAIIVGIGVGYIDQIGQMYSLSRTFVFFPFFLAGYWLSMDQLFKWKTARYRLLSLALMLLLIIGIKLSPDFSTGWLFGSSSYQSLDAPVWGGLFRGMIYMIAFIMTFSLYTWIPRRRFIFTRFGEQTLYVYLLHGIFIQFFREYGVIQINNGLDFIFAIAISLGIVLLLASQPIFISFQPIIELKITGLKQVRQSINS